MILRRNERLARREVTSPTQNLATTPGFVERCLVNSTPGGATHSFGDFLDAGTGSHSLRWVASVLHRDCLLAMRLSLSSSSSAAAPRVTMKSYTAITADEAMRKRVYLEAQELGIGSCGNVLIGNWNDDALLTGRTYDTILADYLVGAIDGFSPYLQDQIFPRLGRHLTPGGRMYVIGLQPIPDSVMGDGDVFCRITKIRAACILLANHRCHREYPMDWIERHLTMAGLVVVETRKYPMNYTYETMGRQINVGRSKLKLFSSRGMAKEMGFVLDELEKESLEVTKRQKDGKVTLGFDYVVVAEKPK